MYIQNNSEINTTLTREYVSLLRKNNLVDSGKLISSTKLSFEMDNRGKGLIKIDSTEYLQYLDDKYKITDTFLKNSRISNLINSIIADFVSDNLWQLDKINDNIEIKIKYYW